MFEYWDQPCQLIFFFFFPLLPASSVQLNVIAKFGAGNVCHIFLIFEFDDRRGVVALKSGSSSFVAPMADITK